MAVCQFHMNLKNRNYKGDGTDFARSLYPCGKCPDCRLNKSKEWYIRLKNELKVSETAHFVTLTYAHAPISPNGYFTADTSHFQNFIKSLRYYEEKAKNPIPPKYYACIEYGSKYQRPHYHLIIFNVKDKRSFDLAWSIDGNSIGRVDIGKVEDRSIQYVIGYVSKKIGIPTSPLDDRLPEQPYISKKLGLSYLDKASNYHKKTLDGSTYIDGKRQTLPRYYKQKLFPDYKIKYTDKFGNQKTRTIQSAESKYIGKKNYKNYQINLQQAAQLYGSLDAYQEQLYHAAYLKKNYSQSKKSPLS